MNEMFDQQQSFACQTDCSEMEKLEIPQAAQCLKDLENNLSNSAHDEEWASLRDDFFKTIDRVRDMSQFHLLFEQLRLLESHINYDKQTDSWRESQREGWRLMTDPSIKRLHDVGHFVAALKVMEKNLLYGAHPDDWNISTRDEWLDKCDSLINHTIQLSITSKVGQAYGTDLEKIGHTPFPHKLHVNQEPDTTAFGNDIANAAQCLKDLESSIPLFRLDEEWASKRLDFISSIDKVGDISDIEVLFREIKSFNSFVKYSKNTDVSEQWEQMYWRIITDMNLDVSFSITRFIITLKFMENHLLDEVLDPIWKDSKRNQWLEKCDALVDPLLQLYFYEELLLKVDDILKQFGYDSLETYETELGKVISFTDIAAQELDKVNTRTGIADTVAGGLGITAGILGGVGLILAPFTAGASTILTLVGLGAGVGSASTSLTSLIVQKVFDKKNVSEVKQQSEKITAETMSLIKVIENHANSVTELKAKLESLGKSGAFQYIMDIGSASSGLVTGSHNIANIVMVARQIAAQGFKTSVAFESAVPSFFKGTTSLASAASIFSGILSVVSIGFGIFGTVLGAKKIKNGSELAKSLRVLAENLKLAEQEIRASFENAKIAFEKCETGVETNTDNNSS